MAAGLFAAAVGAGSLALADRPAASQLPLEPFREAGSSVTAAYEGWYRKPDGSVAFLVGYFNRNTVQTLDIPVGPENRIEPGGPDLGQPTHFLPRRNWGVFSIDGPPGFEDYRNKKLTWILVANGQTTQVPFSLDPLWEVEPYRDAAQGNTPPVLKFQADGPPHQGPPSGFAAMLEATAGAPLTLTVWASDDAQVDPDRVERADRPPVSVFWSKFRGPGEVTFADARPKVDLADQGKTRTTATFSEAGEYILRLQANDISGEGGGGFQCCWTNAHVRVNVTPASQ
jgi:hypothetical protein